MNRKDLLELAKIGASTQIAELSKEIEQLNNLLSEIDSRAVIARRGGSLHWTQTPEGRAKMAKAQKRAWKTRRASKA